MTECFSYKRPLVLGLGQTGFSCVQYLVQQGVAVSVTDSRAQPPMWSQLKEQYPDVMVKTGGFDQQLLTQADCLVVSPGVDCNQESIAWRIREGIPVLGDIELFVQQAKAPIIAVTGSNGKTTVVTMIGEVLTACGFQVEVIGNIGFSALVALLHPVPDYYVLELSSFQLAATHSLQAEIAVVLNVTPDHLDRHLDMENYLAAKQRIYQDANIAIINKDQSYIWQDLDLQAKLVGFSLHAKAEFSVASVAGQYYLMHADKPLLATSHMMLQGQHHMQNALVTLAVGASLNLDMTQVARVIETFQALPHRCQLVAEINGASWFNDSKATNVGATSAAIATIGDRITGRIILLAGGEAKGGDFSVWHAGIEQYVSHVIVFGVAATQLQDCLSDVVEVISAVNMAAAVQQAARIAQQGDAVLLSPGCASFDMFSNYEHRGDVFCQYVREQIT